MSDFEPFQIDLAAMKVGELLAVMGGALDELYRRGVVRTKNAPAGDIAEALVAYATGGELAPPSEKSWDVKTPGGELIQVKARIVPRNDAGPQLSAIRSWKFDLLMVVLFDSSCRVRRASLITADDVRRVGRWYGHTAATNVYARPALLGAGEDWTDRLRASNLYDQVLPPVTQDRGKPAPS